MGQFIKFEVVSTVMDLTGPPDPSNPDITIPWSLDATEAWVKNLGLTTLKTGNELTIFGYGYTPVGYGDLKIKSTLYIYAGAAGDQIAPKDPADPNSDVVLWEACAQKGVTVVQTINNFETSVVQTSANGLNFNITPSMTELYNYNPEFSGQLVSVYNDAGNLLISAKIVHHLLRGQSITLNMQKNVEPWKQNLTMGDVNLAPGGAQNDPNNFAPLTTLVDYNNSYYNGTQIPSKDIGKPIPAYIGNVITTTESRTVERGKVVSSSTAPTQRYELSYLPTDYVRVSPTRAIVCKLPNNITPAFISAPATNATASQRRGYRVSNITKITDRELIVNFSDPSIVPFLRPGMTFFIRNVTVETFALAQGLITEVFYPQARILLQQEVLTNLRLGETGVMAFDLRKFTEISAFDARLRSQCFPASGAFGATHTNLNLSYVSTPNSNVVFADIIDPGPFNGSDALIAPNTGSGMTFDNTSFKISFDVTVSSNAPEDILESVAGFHGVTIDTSEFKTLTNPSANLTYDLYNTGNKLNTLEDYAKVACRTNFATIVSDPASTQFRLVPLVGGNLAYSYTEDEIREVIVNGDSRDMAKTVEYFNPKFNSPRRQIENLEAERYNVSESRTIEHNLSDVITTPRIGNWADFYSKNRVTVEFVLLEASKIPLCGEVIQIDHPDYSGRAIVTSVTQSEVSTKILCQVQNAK